MRSDLIGLTFAEYATWSRAIAGHADRFHRATYQHLIRTGVHDPRQLPVWTGADPATLARLAASASTTQLPVISAMRTTGDAATGRTTKLLMRLHDGSEVESVLIPRKRGSHHTVCVSSQVGCRMGCSFCHTAKMGLVRSLEAHEIIAQVVAAGQVARDQGAPPPRNVVFMGMGEPLDNLDAVAQAVRVLTDVNGFALAHRHITVSTVGRIEGLARWHELGLSRVNLAVSLTAADDALRSELMPVNRTADLAALKAALLAIPLASDRRLLVSYVLIPGVNDGADHAARLLDWVAGLRVLVNLIPYNPIPSRAWRAPLATEVESFARILQPTVAVRIRATLGDDVMAACGQLGDPSVRAAQRPAQPVARSTQSATIPAGAR
ncbi:MAG: 23S rRNA (adenine(2503)-C(2))-methyltransferase RlmN [Planctomycetes bacterium]|nr:23S rRNA (adenine(2503)-C(2))-methyltransferase RlmN [Planctomycetota bacterium]